MHTEDYLVWYWGPGKVRSITMKRYLKLVLLFLLLGTCNSSISGSANHYYQYARQDGINQTQTDDSLCTSTPSTLRHVRAPPTTTASPNPTPTPTPGGNPSGQQTNTGVVPSQSTPDIQEVVNLNGLGKFQVKHMIFDGLHGENVNSYDELTGNPAKLRQYLIDVNRRLFKDKVLPMTVGNKVGDSFGKWVDNARTEPKKLTLVDANIEDIKNDIENQQGYKDYLDRVRKNGNKGLRKDNMFTTNAEFLITDIVLSMDGNELKVSLERHKGKLKIGMLVDTVFHFDKFEQTIQPQVAGSGSPNTNNRHETSFTFEQLTDNAQTTLKFWTELFGVKSIEEVHFHGPMNDQAKKYKAVEAKYRHEWDKIVNPPPDVNPQAQMVSNTPGGCTRRQAGRKKRARGNGCVFYIDHEGEIESIDPMEFMEVYESTGEEGRRRMTGLVKNNADKFIVNDDKNWAAARRRMNQLVHHDELTIHAELVETTGTIQDWRRWRAPVPNKASQMVTAMHEAVRGRMNKVRLSATKVVNSLSTNPHINVMSKLSKPYGNLMLAKGLITGIIHNDTTSLAVIGSRMGYDLVTYVATDVGTKFFNAASKVGRGAKALGKVAGPIGSVADVGLGVWALTKSVGRLKNADNKYDRDDAIVDITSETVDIVVSITTTVLSLAFPPAAPLIAVVGLLINLVNSIATAMFHAGNEVARINAQIPLLGFEKEQVYTSRFFDIFGTRKKDYIDYLVEEKKANDLMVKNQLSFLKENKQFLGVLFPSRTMWYSGPCKLVDIFFPFGSWGNPDSIFNTHTTLGENCDRNAPCGSDGRLCRLEQTDFHIYHCVCDNSAKTEFGLPHKNSMAFFKSKTKIYWERAVPGDVDGAEFKCKPGSLEFVDYKKHQWDSREDYYCSKAIGLYRPKSERVDGQSFLINLEDGDDRVEIDQMSDSTPYTFWMGEEGEKNFWGGSGKNDFILNGNCSSGVLSGAIRGARNEKDSLIITPSCAKGETIQIKIRKSRRFVDPLPVVELKNKLNLQLYHIDNIIGRPKEVEDVDVGCTTRQVFLNGGVSSKSPDSIYVGPLDCPVNLQTVLSNYTNIVSSAKKGRVSIYIGEDMTGSMIHVQNPTASSRQTATVIFTKTSAKNVLLDDITLTKGDVSLKLKHNPKQPEPLSFKFSPSAAQNENMKSPPQYQLYFNESSEETPDTYSILMVPGNEVVAKNSPLTFFHNLQSHLAPSHKNVRRDGSHSIPNFFNISARNWDVRGGKNEDTFLLNIPHHDAKIDGGDGDDTLVITTNQDGLIQFQDNEGLKDIERIVKGDNVEAISISTHCLTKAVVMKGVGRTPDTVQVNNCAKYSRDLQIDAGGNSRVWVNADVTGDQDAVRVLVHDAGQQPISFELDSGAFRVPGMMVQVMLSHTYPDLSVKQLTRKNKDSFMVKMAGAGVEQLTFSLNTKDGNGYDSPYISSPLIQLIPPPQLSSSENPSPVQLVFQRDTLDPVVVHVIQDNSGVEERAIGFEGLQNLFQLVGSAKFHQVFGGRLKDTFVGSSSAFSLGMFTGNPESDNTIVIKDDAPGSREMNTKFHVDLHEGWMGLLTKGSNKRAMLKGEFHHLVGRTAQTDMIVAGCMTKSIAGRGGPGDYVDYILINANKDCKNGNIQTDPSSALELYLGPFTRVENLAERGNFRYFVDLTKSADYISFILNPNGYTSHKVVFTLSPPQATRGKRVEFESIKFDKRQKILTFGTNDHSSSFGDGEYNFRMYQKDEKSDYSNPTFLITSTGDNWHTSEVRVDSEGNSIATSLLSGECPKESDHGSNVVSGLPVQINNFLINITGHSGYGSCGTVHGHPGSVENHFWLYDAPQYKHFYIEGAETLSKEQNTEIRSNTLHLGEDFYGKTQVSVYLSPERGYVKIEEWGDNTTVHLKRIDRFVGRGSSYSYDTVVPSCYTKQVSGVDLVRILLDPSEDCAYNLVIGLEPMTRVQFGWLNNNDIEKRGNMTHFWNSTFHYRFSEPMSFKVLQSYPGMLDGTVHNLYLPFELEDLEQVDFDEEESTLNFMIESEKYSIAMISLVREEDQFYPQPNMVTKDGFKLKIGRDSSILVTGVLKGIPPQQQQQPLELLFRYQEMANTLGITMMIQTDTGFFHIGNNNGDQRDRNVLQNVAYSNSYLGGGGGADTIFEVVSLAKDVYITSWLDHNVSPIAASDAEGPHTLKQTLDLTDIVTKIRLQAGYKYKPKVTQVGEDLEITMEGHRKQYPGKVVLLGATYEHVRENMQVLLSNAMMKFVPSRMEQASADMNHGSHMEAWDLYPVEVHLERETVYSISAEDLEYGHQVVVLDHKYTPEYHFRFNYSRNGDDLHLSDIEEFEDHQYDQRHIEMTTVIITDFYRSAADHSIHRDMNNENEISISAIMPAEIRDVTLFLPGLRINLNGTNVMLLDNNEGNWEDELLPVFSPNQNLSGPMEAPPPPRRPLNPRPPAPVLLSGELMPKWATVLHQVEEAILEGIPFEKRFY